MKRKAWILVISTSAARSGARDTTGPVLKRWLEERGFDVAGMERIADGKSVGRALKNALKSRPRLVITTGGTGLSPDDKTPEETLPFIETLIPGISEAIRAKGIAVNPAAMLTRGLAGFSGESLIVNLPGSMAGVKDGIEVLGGVLDHVLDQRQGITGHRAHGRKNSAPLDSHLRSRIAPDLRVELDRQRESCPVLKSPDGSITLLAHGDVLHAANNPQIFASQVSDRRSIPNSLDGAEHTEYRSLINQFFGKTQVAEIAEIAKRHAKSLLEALPKNRMVLAIKDIGTPFAVAVQRTWLGWPADYDERLIAWVGESLAAKRDGSPKALRAVAHDFEGLITEILGRSLEFNEGSATRVLQASKVSGEPLKQEEIMSILRNWIAGDLGTLASSVGVIACRIAIDLPVQEYLRGLLAEASTNSDADAAFEAALEEILRADDPFVSNRRVLLQDTVIGDKKVRKGTRVYLNWTSANRDGDVFRDPDGFDPEANARHNIVFGSGPHACPARSLSLMQLRVIISEMLGASTQISLSREADPVRELPPVSGWARVPIILSR